MLNIEPIKKELEIFEKNLEKVILSQDTFLSDDIYNFMFFKPKRLRPILIFLISKILKIENENIQKIALITELIHSASLIHDDILDEAQLRRNNPALYKKYDSKTAVMTGDLLLSLAIEMLAETNLEILKIFSNKINKTILGELSQNKILHTIPTIETYLDKTFNKTGNLFLAGIESLFTLSNCSTKQKTALINFTKNFSTAFQIKNDTNDIISDIRNGNYTIVVLYFLKENSINDLNENSNFDKYKKQAIELINNYKNNAINNLLDIDDSIYKDSLKDLCNMVLGNL